MSDEFDRQLIPELFQTVLTISLGATYKGFEMMKSPQKSANTVMSEMRSLFAIPSDAGEGIQNKAKAIAAVWMEKGAGWMEECKAAGNKFTEDDKKAE